MTLAEYLHFARVQRGYTLEDLSTQTGLSVSYLSDLEHGRSEPSLKSLVAIANAYDMGAGDLLVEAGYSVRRNRDAERLAQAKMLAEHALEQAIDHLGEFGYPRYAGADVQEI